MTDVRLLEVPGAAATAPGPPPAVAAVRRRPLLRATLATRSGRLGGALLAVLVLAAAVSLVWTPYDPQLADTAASAVGPLTGGHLLGTDRLGRDQLSLLMAGSRTTLLVAVGTTLIAAGVGLTLALATALAPRALGELLRRGLDVLVAFPALLLAVVLAAVYGASWLTLVVAIGVALGVNLARIARSEVRRVLVSDYVLAATAAGSSTPRTVRRHVLPNIAPTVIVQLSLSLAVAVLAEASLSYVGFGVGSGTPSWGRMLADGQPEIATLPLLVIWPGVAIAATVIAFQLLGDALSTATDPRLRGRRP